MIARPRALASGLLRASVTLACAVWILGRLDPQALAATLTQSDPLQTFAGMLLFASTGALMGLRWHQLLREDAPTVPLRTSVRLSYEGLYYGLALPTAVGGDVYRLIQVHDKAGPWGGLSSLVSERLFGLWGLCLLILGGLAFHPSAVGDYGPAAALLSGGLLVGSGLVLLPATSRGLAELLQTFGLSAVAEAFLQRSQLARRQVARLPFSTALLGLSVAIHLVAIAAVGLFAQAIGIHLPLSWFLVAVPTTWILAMVPSLGGFGPREQALTVLLGAVGVPPNLALAVAGLQAVAVGVRALAGGLSTLFPR